MRISPRRALSALAVSGAVVLTAAACGGGSSSSHTSADAKTAPSAAASSPAADPFAGQTAHQIITAATAAMSSAHSMKVSGTMKESGSAMSLDLFMVKGVGCQGSIDMGSQGGTTIVVLGTTAWEKLDKATLVKAVGAAAAASVSGKYFKTTTTAKDFADLQAFCDLDTFAQGLGSAGDDPFTKGAVTTVDGRPALTLIDTKDQSRALVSLTAPYRIVGAVGPGSDGSITISYDLDTKITPPPASEVFDASKFGL
jgi:hypothetical protein